MEEKSKLQVKTICEYKRLNFSKSSSVGLKRNVLREFLNASKLILEVTRKGRLLKEFGGGGLTGILPLIAANQPVRQRHNAAKCFVTLK